jgi:hypothetical protein
VAKQKLVIGASDREGSVYTDAIIDPETCTKDDAYELAHDVIDRFYDEYEGNDESDDV